jgi:DNA-binding NtrC family response regulator
MNKNVAEIPAETLLALVRYRWPGNIRELQNLIERAVILSRHTVVRARSAELEPFKRAASWMRRSRFWRKFSGTTSFGALDASK